MNTESDAHSRCASMCETWSAARQTSVASLAFHSRCASTRKLPDECTARCHLGAPLACAYAARFFLLLRFFLPARFFPARFLPAFLDARFFPAFFAATRFPFFIAQETFLRVTRARATYGAHVMVERRAATEQLFCCTPAEGSLSRAASTAGRKCCTLLVPGCPRETHAPAVVVR
jgi:hypothetical protein